jgi:uncharacterized protein YdeI (YjbR/CyaY-like superfamily)
VEKHHARATELVVGFRKVGTRLPSMTWSESVDEALCFGWIDGVRKRIDDSSYQIRFTPRRASSIWSAINVAKIAKLKAQGRMHPAGLASYAARSEKKTGIYSFEQEGPVALTPAQTREFKKHKAAWRYFEDAPPGYRKQITYWVVSAKQPATQARRLSQLIQACAEERRLR